MENSDGKKYGKTPYVDDAITFCWFNIIKLSAFVVWQSIQSCWRAFMIPPVCRYHLSWPRSRKTLPCISPPTLMWLRGFVWGREGRPNTESRASWQALYDQFSFQFHKTQRVNSCRYTLEQNNVFEVLNYVFWVTFKAVQFSRNKNLQTA